MKPLKYYVLINLKKFQEQYNRMSKYYSEKYGDSDLCCQVQPISNDTAMCRVCKRIDTSSYFSCDTCDSLIAHEEQFIHSLVVNEGKFIKEQFSVRHFRRDKVTGSYLAHDTVSDISNHYDRNETETEESMNIDRDDDGLDNDSSDDDDDGIEI